MYIFLELCYQAKLYAFIAVFLLLYIVIKNPNNTNFDIAMLLLRAALFIAWTFVLNRLCSTGYRYVAWLAAIIPHIIYFLVLVY